jgi:membrane protease YdiL (CAAX protease family)
MTQARRSMAVRPPSWRVVLVLLRIAWKRGLNRRNRQAELLRQRAGKRARNWAGVGFLLSIIALGALNIGAALMLDRAVASGERIEAEAGGVVVVSERFLSFLDGWDKAREQGKQHRLDELTRSASFEAWMITQDRGGSREAITKRLTDEAKAHGSRRFASQDAAAPGLSALPYAGGLTGILGTIVIAWWIMVLAFQGEGLELDLQRRRHPMWEWLFSHPVAPGAIFLAEMLAPIAANPIFSTAPLFAGCVYGMIYGAQAGAVAALIVGIPATIAIACLGKALEIAVILRFSPRTRGAMIGLMGWLGYASMMLMFLSMVSMTKVTSVVGDLLEPLNVVPWPWLALLLGVTADGSHSFIAGVLWSWTLTAIAITCAVSFCVWGARRGISGESGRSVAVPPRALAATSRFGRNPLYRKEFLWFVRDRSAIVQAILIPVTIAGFQLFNFRGLLVEAQNAWNYLCGAGILFGTYFLWVLGPKSLASEGAALWIAQTWPLGLENLLKAKAWLWSLISSVIVGMVLLYAAFLYPVNIPSIILVGIGWFFFGQSMASKTVTLVSVPSSSGEPGKIAKSRTWAASLGMLTFSIGVLTSQWHVAIMGIVYSYVTAAAMWEHFRARLPYLYDPWSERLPPPPTMMHAMVAISILVEGGAIISAVALAIIGRESIAVAQAVAYGMCAVMVSAGMVRFLAQRGVANTAIWNWRAAAPAGAGQADTSAKAVDTRISLMAAIAMGACAGVVLGGLALGYRSVLALLPWTAELIRHAQEAARNIPDLQASYAVMAIAFAPLAEEYLFRGLLFRSMDRTWGDRRAVIGSAAFFAVYHPLLSWPPVFLLGVVNAALFKRTGRLLPAVILHMVYNTVVVLA